MKEPEYLNGLDEAVKQHHPLLQKRLKKQSLLLGRKKIEEDKYEAIKDSVTFLILQLLQDHQNELKSIRDDISRGRLDLVIMGLNKRLT
jgi:hypothetical protein